MPEGKRILVSDDLDFFLLCMKSIIVKFAVALASIATLALFMWGFAEAFDEEMESHSKDYWERMEEER